MNLASLFLSVVYSPVLVRVSGSAVSGILLSHLIHWDSGSTDPNYWCIRSYEFIRHELALSFDEIDQACGQLKAKGLIECRDDSCSVELIYRVNFAQLFTLLQGVK